MSDVVNVSLSLLSDRSLERFHDCQKLKELRQNGDVQTGDTATMQPRSAKPDESLQQTESI